MFFDFIGSGAARMRHRRDALAREPRLPCLDQWCAHRSRTPDVPGRAPSLKLLTRGQDPSTAVRNHRIVPSSRMARRRVSRSILPWVWDAFPHRRQRLAFEIGPRSCRPASQRAADLYPNLGFGCRRLGSDQANRRSIRQPASPSALVKPSIVPSISRQENPRTVKTLTVRSSVPSMARHGRMFSGCSRDRTCPISVCSSRSPCLAHGKPGQPARSTPPPLHASSRAAYRAPVTSYS